MAFKNAFLPKVNCPKNFKQIRYPEGYDSKDFKIAFQEILKDYESKSLLTTERDGGFQPQTKSLANILGYETSAGSAATGEKYNNEESKILSY